MPLWISIRQSAPEQLNMADKLGSGQVSHPSADRIFTGLSKR